MQAEGTYRTLPNLRMEGRVLGQVTLRPDVSEGTDVTQTRGTTRCLRNQTDVGFVQGVVKKREREAESSGSEAGVGRRGASLATTLPLTGTSELVRLVSVLWLL